MGSCDDFWFRYVTDLGNAGPDKGKGGKFLFLPPDYKGQAPAGYHVFKSRTFGNWFGTRGFQVNGDPKPGVDSIKQHLRIYPLAQAATPPATNFVNVSGKSVQHDPRDGLLLLRGSERGRPGGAERRRSIPRRWGCWPRSASSKGKPFAPDARMKTDPHRGRVRGQRDGACPGVSLAHDRRLLLPGQRVGDAVRRRQLRIPAATARRLLDARSFFFFYATGITPAMSIKMVGAGSQYAVAFVDAKNQPLDGGKTYRLHLPPNIPAKDFWSLVLYDNQTRSMLQTDQQFPSIGSQKKGVAMNPDTSVDVYFGPKAPAGKESNWVQTWPGKGWNVILRLYGPLQPFFDKTWRPGEIEEVR